MLKTRAHRRGLVAALLGVSVGLVNVGCLSSGPAASSTVTGAARETVAPPEAPTPWGLTPDIRVSVEEWAEFIGAVPVDSVEAARRQVAFEVALPDQLAGMPAARSTAAMAGEMAITRSKRPYFILARAAISGLSTRRVITAGVPLRRAASPPQRNAAIIMVFILAPHTAGRTRLRHRGGGLYSGARARDLRPQP